MKVLVFSDKLANYGELCACGRGLGEVYAYVAGNKEEAASVPAVKVYYTEKDSPARTEDFFTAFRSVVDEVGPDAIVISATKRGKYFAARLAASMGTSALTDLSDISVVGGGIQGKQMYYGGAGIRTVQSIGRAVVTVGVGAFEPVGGAAGEVVHKPFAAGDNKTVLKEVRQKEGESVNLAAAKKVIGVGRGFAKKEDLALADAFAKAIGAEIGCSRPIAEGEGWMSTDRYIGVSGVMLKPELYVAVGISGQIQHTIGVNTAKTVIAINKDKNAPIFKQCDYGIVGDLYKILPSLTALVKA